jgi:hypothetical protein
MDEKRTFGTLLTAVPLSDDDLLAIGQPEVYNPVTGKNGDTRRVKVSQFRESMLGDLPEKIAELLAFKADDFVAIGEKINRLTNAINSLKPHAFIGSEPIIFASAKRKLTVRGGTRIDFGSEVFFPHEDVELNLQSVLDTGNLSNGKDYYLHLIHGGANLDVVASLSKTAPNGVSPGESIVLGGCHTLCANAGTNMTYVGGDVTKQHPLNGYIANDILPQSVWCLNHRPYSEPEGMVYIPSLDFWCDIYLTSGVGANTKSVYQGAITRNRQYIDFVEDMFCAKKELLDDGEFAAAMLGSNEGTAVNGLSEAAATDGGAGGRVDTNDRRMISIYGIEEGCWSLTQLLRTTSAAGRFGQIYMQLTTEPTYGLQPSTGGDVYGPYDQSGGDGNFTSQKGKVWGIVGAVQAGGCWMYPVGNGSRARFANISRSHAGPSITARGRSKPMRFASL